MSALVALPSELKLKTLKHILHLAGSAVFEDPRHDEWNFSLTLDASILRACGDMYPHAVDILYGQNQFKFTEITTLKMFVQNINTRHQVSHLIRDLQLEINVFNSEITDWVDYFKDGSFENAFPHLNTLDITFSAYRSFAGFTCLSPLGTTGLDDISKAIVEHVRAHDAYVWGIWGDGAQELGDKLESAMTGREVKRTDCDSGWDELETPDIQMEDDGIDW